jgi:hypothetical protein
VQALHAAFVEALEPLARSARADACRLGGKHQPHSCDAFDKQLATFQCQSGILMAVHPVGFLCDPEAW